MKISAPTQKVKHVLIVGTPGVFLDGPNNWKQAIWEKGKCLTVTPPPLNKSPKKKSLHFLCTLPQFLPQETHFWLQITIKRIKSQNFKNCVTVNYNVTSNSSHQFETGEVFLNSGPTFHVVADLSREKQGEKKHQQCWGCNSCELRGATSTVVL